MNERVERMVVVRSAEVPSNFICALFSLRRMRVSAYREQLDRNVKNDDLSYFRSSVPRRSTHGPFPLAPRNRILIFEQHLGEG
jgi:hypothetical protein